MNPEETTGPGSLESKAPTPPVNQDKKKGTSARPEKVKTSGFQAVMRNIGLGLLFLLIGALVVTLALYLPAQSKLTKAQVEVERLAEIETQYNDLQAKFNLVKEQSGVYKTISDASLLQVALTEKDTTKVNQQLRYVEEDLNALGIMDFPEILQRLQSQFSKIKTSAQADSAGALSELDEFYKDLLLLADNLE
ncbi:MAG TPA: hypothetical protein VMW28_02310 [Pelolinea sp.]|nr:hypothetical protein [Pelolinea sp.]